VLALVDFFALGLLFGLAFIIIVFALTLWRIRRRERRLEEAEGRSLLGGR
jgi:protein-S-isoprenylcysteine O-methyltransferase Ste14